MESFYEYWLTLYPEEKIIISNPSLTKYIASISYHIVILAQNLQFFWIQDFNTADWNDFKPFWNTINAPSIDTFVVRLDFVSNFFIILGFLLGILVSLQSYVALAKYYSWRIPELILSMTRAAIWLICDVLFIPICTFFFMISRYSNTNLEAITQYSGNKNPDIFNFSAYGEIGSIICISYIVLLTLCHEVFSYQIRHLNKTQLRGNKISCKVSLLIKSLHFVLIYISIYYKASNYNYYLITIFCIYAIIVSCVIYNMPFYSFWMNFMQVFIYIDCVFSIMFFYLGHYIKSSSITVLLFAIMQPVLFILSSEIIKQRTSKIINLADFVEESFQVFEFVARKFLASGEMNEELLDFMRKNNKIHNNKLNNVLQAYYCADILDNHLLGYNKIIQVSTKGLDIITNYQVFKCKKSLLKVCEEFSEGIKLHKYFVDFNATKIQDKIFCEMYMSFLYNLIQNPVSISKMKTSINMLVGKIELLRIMYGGLLEKFPSSHEAKNMYGSLLLHILYDSEVGNKYLHRLTETRSFQSRLVSKHNLNFATNRCFLIVSGDEKTIGKLLYYNSTLLEYLNITSKSIDDYILNDFIPKIFRKNHDYIMLRFIDQATTTIVFKCTPSFMVDSNGFLSECTLSSESIGYENSVNFICTIDPVVNKDRGFAMLGIDGTIQEHSRNFSSIVGSYEEKIEGQKIKHFLPTFDADELLSENVVEHMWNIRKSLISVTLQDTIIGNSLLRVIFVSLDNTKLTKSNLLNPEKLKSVDGRRISFIVEEVKESYGKMQTQEKLGLDSKEGFGEKSKHSTQSSSCVILNPLEYASYQKAVNVLKITKIVLIISILVLLLSNVVIIVYISKEVAHVSSLSGFIDLSNLLYSIAKTTLVVRSYDVYVKTGKFEYFSLEDVKTVSTELKKAQDKLLENYDSWSYCPASKIITSRPTAYWVLENEPTLKFNSLYTVVGKLVQNVDDIYVHFSEGSTDYESHLFFILINSMGEVFTHTNKTIEELAVCEVERIKSLNFVIQLMLIGGVIVIAIVFAITAISVCTINAPLNSLWDYLRKRAKSSYPEVIHLIQERLCSYHEDVESLDEKIDISIGTVLEGVNYNHSARYLIRFSLLFIFTGMVYIISSFVFFSPIYENLAQRPLLLKSITLRRIQLIEISLYAFDMDSETTNYSLNSIFPNFYPLTDPLNSFLYVLSSIKSSKTIVSSPKSLEIMSADVKKEIYEYSTGSNFFTFGFFRASAYLTYESYDIAYNNKQETESAMVVFLKEILEYNDKANSLALGIENCSKDIIQIKLSNYILFISFCCAVLMLFYLIYYYPFLSHEIKILNNISKILLILPNLPVIGPSTAYSKSTMKLKTIHN